MVIKLQKFLVKNIKDFWGATILAKSPWDTTTLSSVFTGHLKPTRFDAKYNFKLPPPPSPHSMLMVGVKHTISFSIFNIEQDGGREGAFLIKLKPLNV